MDATERSVVVEERSPWECAFPDSSSLDNVARRRPLKSRLAQLKKVLEEILDPDYNLTSVI